MSVALRICALLSVAAALPACGPNAASSAPTCLGDETICEGGSFVQCRGGEVDLVEACDGVCVDGLGCRTCTPGSASCTAEGSSVCTDDGLGYQIVDCGPTASCDIDTGRCVPSACDPGALGNSYIGCDYYPTVTGNIVNDGFSFAVVVANATDEPAEVAISGGALVAERLRTIAPGGVAVEALPWQPELKICSERPGDIGPDPCAAPLAGSPSAISRAYRVRSSQPVTVYQFSPLDYRDGFGGFSFTNDASLLIPSNAMGNRHVVASWPSIGGRAGLLAVVAPTGARVTVTPSTPTLPGSGIPALRPGEPASVDLRAGEVVQILADAGDLTGTIIEATAPVQVLGGHMCTYVPLGSPACDHLEESMLPITALSDRYVVTAPAVPQLPAGRQHIVRVITTEADTAVSFDPPVADPHTIERAGGFLELTGVADSFEVTASAKILVAQYMVGQTVDGNAGDPSMSVAVPVDQYRLAYLFHAPTNYASSYVDIVAPLGTRVRLDGGAIDPAELTPVGSSGLGLVRVPLGPGNGGNHRVEADRPVGISVYGYGDYTSYWYPGGLDLEPIVIE